MGQKINPISLRLQNTNRHFDSSWYSDFFYKKLITRDIFLQHYLNTFLKLLKLPTGRYSIQHLQKKTQVYNFLCYSKSTREWRSKLFGLTRNKKITKRNRFFIKNTNVFLKRGRKFTKLRFFYKSLNQVGIHKIQKRITSFQNFQLWSQMSQTHSHLNPNLVSLYLRHQNRHLFSSFFFSSKKATKGTQLKNLAILKKVTTNDKKKFLSSSNKQKAKSTVLLSQFTQLSTTLTGSHLVFLQNLFVYKMLKSVSKNQTFNKKTGVLNYQTTLFKKSEFNEFSLVNLLSPIKSGSPLSAIKSAPELVSNYGNFQALDFKYTNYLESFLSSWQKTPVDVINFRVKNDWQNASYLADEIVYFLQKRVAFRRLKTKLIRQLSKIPAIRGVRITCSGRVGGKSKKAQRAKMECIKHGQTSLQVFSSKIDFSVKTAFTNFGAVGVKVWICYN